MRTFAKIVITGSLGYVAPSVIRRLRATYPGATLVGFDIGYFAHCVTGAASAPESLLDVQYFGDVRRPPDGLFEDADAVVHLAAISNDPMGNAHKTVTLEINYRASVEIAGLAKAAGARAFVFASSCSVYGLADDRPRTEQSAVNPLTPYARSKVLTERTLADLADRDFQVTCLRFATACGMSDRLRLDLVLNDFVASAIATGRITVLSDGSPWRPLINVQDMARAIEWAIARERDAGGPHLVVNAGSNDWNYRMSELAEAVAAQIPGTDVSINRDAPADKRSYRVDFSRFADLAPHHVPAIGLDETIRELQRGLRRMRFADADFRRSPLMRLHTLTMLQAEGLLSHSLEWTANVSREMTGLVA